MPVRAPEKIKYQIMDVSDSFALNSRGVLQRSVHALFGLLGCFKYAV